MMPAYVEYLKSTFDKVILSAFLVEIFGTDCHSSFSKVQMKYCLNSSAGSLSE